MAGMMGTTKGRGVDCFVSRLASTNNSRLSNPDYSARASGKLPLLYNREQIFQHASKITKINNYELIRA
jgi:hypothetical protein